MRSVADYKLKAEVLASGIVPLVNAIDLAEYNLCVNGIIPKFEHDKLYGDIFITYGYKYIQEARKINQASYRRVERLRDRILSYLEFGQCKFITLTFNDEVLSNTSKETRRQYVSRFLKSISDYYVANIDYGKDHLYKDRQGESRQGTCREHYHAVVVCDYHDGEWPYGFILTENIRYRQKTSTKLSKYVSKLTNHAIKSTTKRACYIYSRKPLPCLLVNFC